MRPLMPPVQTPDNLFHDGNPLTGELGTIVDAEHLNNVQGAVRDAQSELITVLTAAGINVDPTKQNQLLTALKALLLSRSNPFGDIKSDGAAAIATALTNLGIDRVEQLNNETKIYAGDDHSIFLSIRIDGLWGIYDPLHGFIPLGIEQGGTGARDADGAKKNLELDRIQQRPGETVMFSDATKTKFMTARSDNTWGYYNDDLQTFIALPVSAGGTGSLNSAGARTNLGLGAVATEDKVPLTKGGTGATDATGARINLSLDRIEQRPNETVMFGDAFKDKYLTARTDNSWGYYNTSLGKFIPLSVVAGGTGANDAPTARNNLGMGNAATGHVRTGKISMAGDKFFSTPFPNECTAITFGVLIGQTWMFSPCVTYLTKAGFGFDGRCWSGVTGTDAQPFGEEVYYIAWGN
ncbi:TPA: hypothetical protein L1M38_001321 [Enterobacter chengduensis]|nr:hypothetical protein [Enterobacter chengduensis]